MMTRWRVRLSVVSALGLSSALAWAEPIAYTIDPIGSGIVIHVGKTGLFAFAGHEHEIHGPVSKGTLVFDLERLEASSADITFDPRALRVSDKGEPSKDVPKVQEAMLGPDCLDVGRFPAIRFVSKTISSRGVASGEFEVTGRGTLTLHGVSREIVVPLHVDIRHELLSARGTTTLRQTDFGMKPISVAGVVKVKDEVQIDLRLVARRAH